MYSIFRPSKMPIFRFATMCDIHSSQVDIGSQLASCNQAVLCPHYHFLLQERTSSPSLIPFSLGPVPCQIAGGPFVEQRNELYMFRRLDFTPFVEDSTRGHRRKRIARAKIFDAVSNIKGVQGVSLVVEPKVHAIHQSAAVLDRLRQKSMEDMTHHNAGAI